MSSMRTSTYHFGHVMGQPITVKFACKSIDNRSARDRTSAQKPSVLRTVIWRRPIQEFYVSLLVRIDEESALDTDRLIASV